MQSRASHDPRVVFPKQILPYLLVAPQLAITLVFFYWPASQALYQSMLREDRSA
jgi:sn-glycerol 3-phosphate transport system permease protein